MERHQINKVYINPNFKRPLEKPLPYLNLIHEQSNVENLHKYDLKLQNDKSTRENKFTNKIGTIYLNPNFKRDRMEQNLLLNAIGRCEKNENIDKQTLVSKSLTSEMTSMVYKSSNYSEINNGSTVYKTNDTFYNQNIKTQTVLVNNKPKGVPVIKSRYCIVRKKKLSENLEKNKQTIIGKDMRSCIIVNAPVKTLSPLSCYSNKIYLNKSLEINQENKILCKPLEKIAKISLSRYKTVPITDLKKNYTITRGNDYKLNSILQSDIKIQKHKLEYPLQTFNKNRFKLTRLNTKFVANTTEETSSKVYFQTINKSVWRNQNKTKLTKEDFKLNNIPCRLFKKYGKCLRKDYGKCEYLHDKKHVSLCRKFLKGICHDSDCPLSHELTSNKMPTCYFYLNGVCTKENCPYLHIKLSDKINICQSFLRGYCERGDSCTFRHVNVQKLVAIKNAKVKKGKVKISINKKKCIVRSGDLKEAKMLNTEENDVECRYYKEMVASEGSCENINPSRCKLGTLPSFIHL